MATYLTDVWELSITHAAAIVNLYSGMVGIIPVGLIFIVYMTGFTGSYWMILLSRFSFTAGLVLLTLSTPPVLSWATGTCSASEAECIGQVQKILFYTSLPLIAVGVSAHLASTLTFIDELLKQRKSEPLLPSSSESDQQTPTTTTTTTTTPESNGTAGGRANSFLSYFTTEQFFGVILMVMFPAAALLAIGYISSWWIRFGIGAICTLVSTAIFLSGLSSYPRGPRPQPIRLTKIFRVQDTKTILTLIATCTTCIITGVVISIGNTYFIEQATDLNHYVGSLWVPVIFFPVFFQELSKKLCAREIKWCAGFREFGIAVSMVFATLCCITAAKVETRRLGLVESEGFVDEPTSVISMTMFWLLPQFLLLGVAEDLSERSVIKIFTEKLEIKTPEEDVDAEAIREDKKMYMKMFAQAVSGVGIICGVLSVYVVGEVSAKVGGTSWFQYTLNKSHLDNYYWALAALTAANLVVYVLLYFVDLI
ncbi:protein NRT1/ PTR FAMILY 5.6-like [Prunus avium]|uniref:Protein NRT1/ PTR FAMILY 5.6-like n=1 Tax=Prunus avium TaxID=42229 RepID=A0A6P5RKP9_PRUAV|nr:protein NRT1/ PTR FAMILY 5.6-like [Prunus avium]